MHGLKLIEFSHRFTQAISELSQMIVYSHANKTHFDNKSFVFSLVLKLENGQLKYLSLIKVIN